MKTITFKELEIQHLCKPSLKHSYISVKPDLNGVLVLLKTPKVSDSFIQNLLLEKEPWIRKQLVRVQNRANISLSLEDEVMLFGDIYSMDSSQAYPLHVELQKVKTADEKKILKAYDNFYMEFAKEYLTS